MEPEHILRELAVDGVWTSRQLHARLANWGASEPSHYLTFATMPVRVTSWAHHAVHAVIVRPNPKGREVLRAVKARLQEIRPAELEHALGLAELRWRCEIPAERYRAQDALGRDHRGTVACGGAGLGPVIADGIYELPDGIVLCEYDHGRYSARQIMRKLSGFRSTTRVGGQRVLGSIWGAPSERRATWLRSLGVGHIIVMEPGSWLG